MSWLSSTYEVVALRDGFEALKWLQAGNLPDLVVLDIEMPRLDGYQFLRNIRYSGIFYDLPVIALTSHTQNEVEAKCADYRLSAIFSKPFKPEILKASIDSAVEQKALSQVA